MRDTLPTRIVLRALLAERCRYGYEIADEFGLHATVVTGILRRLLAEGLVVDHWEDRQLAVGRPPRRYYELTEAGRARAEAVGPVSGAA